MSGGLDKGLLTVYIPFHIPTTSVLGGKRSVLLHFLKHPSPKTAGGLFQAIRQGRRYLDSKRNALDPWTFLGRALWSLAGINSHRVVIHVYTNAKKSVFNEFVSNYPQSNNFEIIYREIDLQKLEHPYMLTWTPRIRMKTDIENGKKHDLYLYLEHDIDFRSENLNYFIEWRRRLKNGVIPGFMLVEWNSKGKFWSNFQIEKHDFGTGQKVAIDGFRFIPLKQPYCPVLLLDQELAEEFLQSEFYELENFREMQSQFGLLTRESAAIGLTYFGREKSYEVRSYVGFHEENRFPTVGAIVRHMPDIYSDYESVPQCKNPLLDMW